MNGAQLIADERLAQVQRDGWTPDHDDRHVEGELLSAAQSYIIEVMDPGEAIHTGFWPENWIWNPSEDPVRNLVKAGALIAAEIDRLKRMDDGDNG